MHKLNHSDSNENNLRIRILRALMCVRQDAAQLKEGPSGVFLIEHLGVELLVLEKDLIWLRENELIQTGSKCFLITKKGIEYFLAHGEDDFPPNDPSRVPRFPLPDSGASEIQIVEPKDED